jgi:hypothetical protein
MSDSEKYINQITLDCLLNKEQYHKHIQSIISKKIDKKDKKFYRKRIYNLTKDLLVSKEQEHNLLPDVKFAFENYVHSCIHYFKVLDNNDILQEDYRDLKNTDDKLEKDFSQEIEMECEKTKNEADKKMMRSINIKNCSLDNFVKVKNYKKENIILPKQKEVNLKDPLLKNKGIKKKKNIPNNYEEKEDNKEKENNSPDKEEK